MSSYEEENEEYLHNPFIKSYGYSDDDTIQTESKSEMSVITPKILLMGSKKSGKTSIQKVVFHKMAPSDTIFLDSTSKILKSDINYNSFLQFQILDFPSQIDNIETIFESEIFSGFGSVLFVIDSTEDYSQSLFKFIETIIKVHKINPKINFEAFIHKVDGISDDYRKNEILKEIQKTVEDDLSDNNIFKVNIRYFFTSIHDRSIFEAFSKVIQKLIPRLSTLENLLDILVSNSKLEKAFLFDISSKICLATDSIPVETPYYELCAEMIDVLIDISSIYGSNINETNQPLIGIDNQSSSTIQLDNGRILHLRSVNKNIALVSIIKKENFSKIGLIKYNFNQFKKALTDIFSVKKKIEELK